jgi:hypothetical protein
MRVQRFSRTLACGVTVLAGLFPTQAPTAAQDVESYSMEARVWLDRDPTLQRGDRARIYYRVDQNAYVAIFHIDSNGTARMVFPSSPQENHYALGGRDYRVLFPGSSFWLVDDDPGVGYFFIVASPRPLDFRQFGYAPYSGGWDLSGAGSQVYRDPYLAMDDYVAALIPDWEFVGYALDFTEYHVDGHYDYPRFLCYDCHSYQPYYSWNPYQYSCTTFRVVIYSDPYFYPTSRYLGTRVVYVQPRRGVAHYGFKERAYGEPGTPQVVVRDTPPTIQPGVAGGEVRRAVPRAGITSPASPGSATGNSSSGTSRGILGVNGTASRRTTGSSSGSSATTPLPSGVVRGGGQTGVTSPGRSSANPGTTQGTRTIRPSDPRAITTPPRTGTPGRPVLELRPPASGSTASPPTVMTPPRTPVTRPSGILTKPRGGGTTTTTRPTVRSGGTTTTRPTVRSGGTTTTRPTVRSGGTTTTRPTVRSGGTTTTRPTVRSGGTTTTRPTVRSGGTTTTTRPTVRSGGSGTTSRPPVGKAKPPPPRRPGGGGG